MTRTGSQDPTKQRRAYEAAVNKELRHLVRRTGWRKRENVLFLQREGFFVSAFLLVWLNADKVSWTLELKPMAVDPVFWAIMDLEANALEPLSLRASGAFTCAAVPVIQAESTAPFPSPAEMGASFLAWADSSATTFVSQYRDAPFSAVIERDQDFKERGAYAETFIAALITEGRTQDAALVVEEFRSGKRRAAFIHTSEGTSFFDRAARWLAMIAG